jgi:hypothetical protein
LGLPKIGEGWIAESELYYKLVQAFPKLDIIHQGRLKWLGKQSLDIYIPQIKIGIEYQGFQHFEPVDFFGGEKAFNYRKKLDEKKKMLCDKHRCKLIYVLPGYDFDELVYTIQDRIDHKFL